MRDPLSVVTNLVSDRFDFEDHLIERETTLNSQPTTIHIVYDGDGNRVRKTVTTGTNVVSTWYLVDDRNPTGYAQVLEELTQDASLPTPAVTRVYTYGLSLLSQDQLVGSSGPDLRWLTSYYGVDGHGSVRYLTDTNGVITDTYDYDAFGNLIARTGTTPNNYLFSGEQFDPDLNLYYLRARYADPDRGRFWTQDSFEGFGEDPPSWHKYTFCQNDPVNRIDPSGHFTMMEGMTVSTLAPMVRGMALSFFDGAINSSHGLALGSALKATSRAEAYMIDSLAQGPGWQMGKQEFWATAKGAPFLLANNPNIATTAKPCWYECATFDSDAPIYGPSAKHPIFEFEQSELYKYVEAGTAPLLIAAGVGVNMVDAIKGVYTLGKDLVAPLGYGGMLLITGGNMKVAEDIFGPETHELIGTGTGLARMALDEQAAKMYGLMSLVSPGAAEEFFGASARRYGQEVKGFYSGVSGGEGQPFYYRVGYFAGNFIPLLGQLGRVKALATAGTLARAGEGIRAVGLASKTGEAAEVARALGTAQKIETCKPPPKILAELRDLNSNVQRVRAAKTATAAAPGARATIGSVQATEIAGRLTPAQMAALQAEHGTEFAQVYLTGPGRAGGGGTYYLIQGAEGTVQVPIGSNVRWINHSHPELLQGGVVPLEASGADYNVLRLLQQAGSPQRTSQIVPEVGTPFNFRR